MLEAMITDKTSGDANAKEGGDEGKDEGGEPPSRREGDTASEDGVASIKFFII